MGFRIARARSWPRLQRRSDQGRKRWLPGRFDFVVGAFWGSVWSVLLVRDFPWNEPGADFMLATTYLLAYSVFWILFSWLARNVVGLMLGSSVGRGSRLGIQRAAALGGSSLVSGLVLLQPIVPRLVWRGSMTLIACAVLITLTWRWTARGAPSDPSVASPRCPPRRTFDLAFPGILALLALARWVVPACSCGTKPLELAAAPSADSSLCSVHLLAIDGLDPRWIQRLLEQDRLPHFERLLERGAAGPLQTVSAHSPVVWTSIATGLPASKHGIRRYTMAWLFGLGVALPVERRDFIGRGVNKIFPYRVIGPVSSNERKVKALWEVLSDLHRESLVVNWWATYPAESIDGVMISDNAIPWKSFHEDEIADLETAARLVAPSDRRPEVLGVLRDFVRGADLQDLEREPQGATGVEYYRARDAVAFRLFEGFSSPSQAFATVYLQGVDAASHAYTTVVFGPNIDLERPRRVSEDEARRLWDGLVARAYEKMDERLGQLTRDGGEEECLIVVSDHGWEYDGTSHWGKPPGVFLAYGEPFAPGARVTNAHVFDLFPTIAYLLDVPISRQLPGKILDDSLATEIRAAHPPLAVECYGERRQRIAFETPAADAHLERLRGLGYID